jgi:hypothetical protein
LGFSAAHGNYNETLDAHLELFGVRAQERAEALPRLGSDRRSRRTPENTTRAGEKEGEKEKSERARREEKALSCGS